MLLELSVLPKGKSRHVGEAAADLGRIIDASGLYHESKNKGTVLEGTWEQLMAVAKKCHDEVMKTNEQFVTVMRAIDGPEVDGPDVDGHDVTVSSHASGDCAALKELLEDDGDWLIP
jgi:uncharacterized protein YqgV (UPF0045/DUF77 family)